MKVLAQTLPKLTDGSELENGLQPDQLLQGTLKLIWRFLLRWNEGRDGQRNFAFLCKMYPPCVIKYRKGLTIPPILLIQSKLPCIFFPLKGKHHVKNSVRSDIGMEGGNEPAPPPPPSTIASNILAAPKLNFFKKERLGDGLEINWVVSLVTWSLAERSLYNESKDSFKCHVQIIKGPKDL